MVIRRHATVHGLVQGVGYRAACRREARRLGLGGWVRNRADGTVEAVVEGEPAAVALLVRWLHHGPPGARVTGVTVTEEEPRGLRDFVVA